MEQEKTTRQAMSTHFQHWQASGLSQMAYSNGNGLAFHKFNYWCRKFQKAAGHSGAPVNLKTRSPNFTTKKPDLKGVASRAVTL